MHHVAAHPAEPNEADLHCQLILLESEVAAAGVPAFLVPAIAAVSSRRAATRSALWRRTGSAGRPSPRSVSRSPSACAFLSVVNVYGAPGMLTSSAASWRSCRKRPVRGPPL